jgi:hypothetical protein
LHSTPQVSRLTDGANLETRARRILLGTGKHARPIIPPIPNDNSVAIMHSSQITDFAAAASGKRVAVVGAGASGLDLCLNSLEAGAAGPVEWILREPKFFSGCEVRTMWPMVMLQLMLGAFALHLLNLAVNLAVFLHHSLAGTRSWVPRAWFDMRRTQYVPGRSLLLRRRKDLSRHAGAEVSKVEGGAVHLSTGEVLHGIDTLLLGTGYAPPERPDGFEKPTNFAAFLATGPKAAGKLLLVGEDLLDATGKCPLAPARSSPRGQRRPARRRTPRCSTPQRQRRGRGGCSTAWSRCSRPRRSAARASRLPCGGSGWGSFTCIIAWSTAPPCSSPSASSSWGLSLITCPARRPVVLTAHPPARVSRGSESQTTRH